MIRERIRRLLRKGGLDIVSFNPSTHPLARRMFLLKAHHINIVFDVGANTGQYARQLREIGYQGKIVSFEPLTSAYKELVKQVCNDPSWDSANIALGNFDGKAIINIARNSYSSSILDMLPALASIDPEITYVGKEEIVVRKMDSIIEEYRQADDKLFVKIDAQGYERMIIEGADKSLPNIIGIQMEVSLVPLYKDETLLAEMIRYMSDKGYTLMSFEPSFSDPNTGQLLQVDSIFFRA